MSVRSNYSSGAPWESIAGYSRAVRVGKVVEIAGTTAVNSDGQIIGVGDIGVQTEYIFKKIDNVLKEAEVICLMLFVLVCMSQI